MKLGEKTLSRELPCRLEIKYLCTRAFSFFQLLTQHMMKKSINSLTPGFCAEQQHKRTQQKVRHFHQIAQWR